MRNPIKLYIKRVSIYTLLENFLKCYSEKDFHAKVTQEN